MLWRETKTSLGLKSSWKFGRTIKIAMSASIVTPKHFIIVSESPFARRKRKAILLADIVKALSYYTLCFLKWYVAGLLFYYLKTMF